MSAAELQQEIERTREQLGQTVDELAAKVDFKARAKEKTAEVAQKAREKVTVARDKARERAAETQHKALEARNSTRGKAVELSGRVRRSEVAQRRWPAAVAGAVTVAVAASMALRRRRSR